MEQKIFDLSLLEQMNDQLFLRQLVDLYLEDTPADLYEMSRAMENGDLDIVAKKAHKLKSSTGMLKALPFLHLLEQIESLIRNKISTPEIYELVQCAPQEFYRLKKALHKYLQLLPA